MVYTTAWHRPALTDCGFQSRQGALGVDLPPDGIPDDLAVAGIQNHRQINKSRLDMNVRDISDPDSVRLVRNSVAVQIGKMGPSPMRINSAPALKVKTIERKRIRSMRAGPGDGQH